MTILEWFKSLFKKEVKDVPLPGTEELCVALGKPVRWKNGACELMSTEDIKGLSACAKSGNLYDFTLNKCESSFDYTPSCTQGQYWYVANGEIGKCIDLPKACDPNVNRVSLGFQNKYTRSNKVFFISLIVAVVAAGLYRNKKTRYVVTILILLLFVHIRDESKEG